MKIGLSGTMSVGKTTLVQALKETERFKDYNFRVERSKYLRDLGIPLNTDSTLKGQTVFLAERCAELMNTNIITDRTIIDVMSFTQCAKSIDTPHKTKFIDYASTFLNEYDYIIYIPPEGVDIEDNNVRETDEHYRDLIDFTINHMLDTYSYKNFKLIKIPPYLNTEERVEFILKSIPEY